MMTIEQRRENARKAVEAYQKATRTDDGNAIADLVCDLMHLAAEWNQDAIEQVRRGIWHNFAETHNEANATVYITVEGVGHFAGYEDKVS